MAGKKEVLESDVMDTLKAMDSGHCGFDQNLETQAGVLSTKIRTGAGNLSGLSTSRIPIDFIGRVESFVDDFELLFQLAASRTGKAMSKSRQAEFMSALQETHANSTKEKDSQLSNSIAQLRDSKAIEQKVRHTLRQDLACFG